MDPTKAKTRFVQELALVGALKEKSLTSLRELQAEAEAKVVTCNEFMEKARPFLEPWKDAGFQDDTDMAKLAPRSLRVLPLRQDAAMAAARCGQLLEENEEKPKPEKAEAPAEGSEAQ